MLWLRRMREVLGVGERLLVLALLRMYPYLH